MKMPCGVALEVERSLHLRRTTIMDSLLTRVPICTAVFRRIFAGADPRDESTPVGKRLARAAGDHFSRHPDRAVKRHRSCGIVSPARPVEEVGRKAILRKHPLREYVDGLTPERPVRGAGEEILTRQRKDHGRMTTRRDADCWIEEVRMFGTRHI